MRCPSCGRGELVDAKTTYFYSLPNCYVIIENVPCQRCDECGEEIIDMKVMKKLEQITALAAKIADRVFITDYQKAA